MVQTIVQEPRIAIPTVDQRVDTADRHVDEAAGRDPKIGGDGGAAAVVCTRSPDAGLPGSAIASVVRRASKPKMVASGRNRSIVGE